MPQRTKGYSLGQGYVLEGGRPRWVGVHACRSMPISSRSSTIISAPDLHRTPVPRQLPGNAPARAVRSSTETEPPQSLRALTINRIGALTMNRIRALTIAVRVPTIAVRVPTIAFRVPTIALRVPTIALRALTIAVRVPTIAVRVPTIAVRVLINCTGTSNSRLLSADGATVRALLGASVPQWKPLPRVSPQARRHAAAHSRVPQPHPRTDGLRDALTAQAIRSARMRLTDSLVDRTSACKREHASRSMLHSFRVLSVVFSVVACLRACLRATVDSGPDRTCLFRRASGSTSCAAPC